MTPRFKPVNRPSASPIEPRPGNSGQRFTSVAVGPSKRLKMSNAQTWERSPPSGPRYGNIYPDYYRPAKHHNDILIPNRRERDQRTSLGKITSPVIGREQPVRQRKLLASVEQSNGLAITPAFGGPDVYSDYDPDDDDAGSLSDGSSEKSSGMSSKHDGSSAISPTSSQRHQPSMPSSSSAPTFVARSSSARLKEEDVGVGNGRGMSQCYPFVEYKRVRQESFADDELMEIDEQQYKRDVFRRPKNTAKQSIIPMDASSSSPPQSRERSNVSPTNSAGVAPSRKRSADHLSAASPSCKRARSPVVSLCSASTPGDFYIKGCSSKDDVNSASTALKKREVDNPLRKSKNDLAQDSHDVKGFDHLPLAAIRHIARCSKHSQELIMFCRLILAHEFKPEKENEIGLASDFDKEQNSPFKDCTEFAEKFLASNVDPLTKRYHNSFPSESGTSKRGQSEIAPVNFYGSSSLTKEISSLDFPAESHDKYESGLTRILETSKELLKKGFLSNVEKTDGSSPSVRAVDIQSHKRGRRASPPSFSPSMQKSPASSEKRKRKRQTEETRETDVDSSPKSSPKGMKRRGNPTDKATVKRSKKRGSTKSSNAPRCGETPCNSPEPQVEKEQRVGRGKGKGKVSKAPCPPQPNKGKNQAAGLVCTKDTATSRSSAARTASPRNLVEEAKRNKGDKHGPKRKRDATAENRSSIRKTPSPTPARSGSKGHSRGHAQSMDNTPTQSPASSNGSTDLPSLFSSPFMRAIGQTTTDVYNIGNATDSPPRNDMRAPSTAFPRAPISTQGLRKRHQSVPANMASHDGSKATGNMPLPQSIVPAREHPDEQNLLDARIAKAVERGMRNAGLSVSNHTQVGPASQTPTAPLASQAPPPTARVDVVAGPSQTARVNAVPRPSQTAAAPPKKRKRPSAAEQKRINPEKSADVPRHERLSDAELLEIGRNDVTLERHYGAPYAFTYRGRLRAKYTYLLGLRAEQGFHAWTDDEIPRLFR